MDLAILEGMDNGIQGLHELDGLEELGFKLSLPKINVGKLIKPVSGLLKPLLDPVKQSIHQEAQKYAWAGSIALQEGKAAFQRELNRKQIQESPTVAQTQKETSWIPLLVIGALILYLSQK
ncbi:MAG: hypothetical protein L3J76_03340 [Candidatus Hydrothermae bacterium]|nr:hypothetical protein [Candidatus Hydrothermae bacterium]